MPGGIKALEIYQELSFGKDHLTQAPRVELLEHVFVVQVLEDLDGVGQLVVDLVLADALEGLLQEGVAVTGELRNKKMGKEYSTI